MHNIPKFSHSHILQSQWRNREIIIDKGFLGYMRQFYDVNILQVISYTTNQNSYLKKKDFI